MARVFGLVLNRSAESKYPCLISSFRGIAFNFFPVTCGFFTDALY